jgi:hypothetical protein
VEKTVLFLADTAGMEPRSCAGPGQRRLTDDTATIARYLAAVKDTDTIISCLQLQDYKITKLFLM